MADVWAGNQRATYAYVSKSEGLLLAHITRTSESRFAPYGTCAQYSKLVLLEKSPSSPVRQIENGNDSIAVG